MGVKNKGEEPPSILVADDEPTNLDVLLTCLSAEGYRVLVAEDGESAVERAKHVLPDLVLLDVLMPGMDGHEACRELKSFEPTRNIPVIFMTALDDLQSKIRAFELGAADYVTKPFRHEEILARVATQLSLARMSRELETANVELEKRVAERTTELASALHEVKRLKDRLEAENTYLQEELRDHLQQDGIIGSSDELRSVITKARKVAPSNTTVMICGETGTGKELIARTVHEHSLRAERPLVKLNCAVISGGLVESELFGHVKGAFTGAVDKRAGRFEVADGGTLFLDEVSELPLETQAKLLRVLQEQEFESVGSSITKSVDVRIIVATNHDLMAEVKKGNFRSDLYYRLNVFALDVPPLRDRDDDVVELARFFLEQFARKHQKSISSLAVECLQQLKDHDWPGNVRELQNVMERSVILCEGDQLVLSEQFDSNKQPKQQPRSTAVIAENTESDKGMSYSLSEIEKQHIIATLKRTNGVVDGPNGAAVLLDLKPSTARFRIKKLGILKSDYVA